MRDACAIGETVLAGTDDRLRAAMHLAGRWATLAGQPGEEAALEQALGLIRAELAAAARDDPQRLLAVSALAGVHLRLWQRDRDRETLVAGLQMVTAELRDTQAPLAMVNIAGLMSTAAEETSDLHLLTRAEDLVREALAAEQLAPQARADLNRLFATMLLDHYDWTGQRQALTEAFAVASRAAYDAEELDDSARARALSIRAVIRSELARTDGDRAELIAAIDDIRAARRLDPDDSEYAMNLANMLSERYHLVGNSADLDEAIALLDGTLAARLPADSFAAIATNHASNLLDRFERDLVLA